MMTSLTGAKLATLIALSAATIGCASSAFSTKNDAMYCEIKASDMGGMIMLENLVHADTVIQGTYRFKLKSTGGGGSTNISQGSNFTASPGAPATLGRMTLNSGVIYEAKLDVTVNGVSFTCAERIGGAT